MDQIKFVHLSDIDENAIIDLMNNEEVGKLLPLLKEGFTSEHCKAFVKAKKNYGMSTGLALGHLS